MKITKNNDSEYGVDWIIKDIIEENLTPINCEEIYEQLIEDCYPETTQVGYLTLNTLEILKTQDEISWELAKSEYIDFLAQDEEIISFDNGSTYYLVSDIETYIEENLEDEAA